MYYVSVRCTCTIGWLSTLRCLRVRERLQAPEERSPRQGDSPASQVGSYRSGRSDCTVQCLSRI